MYVLNKQEWKKSCVKKLKNLYGDNPHRDVKRRFYYELSLIINMGNAPIYQFGRMLVRQSENMGAPVATGGNIQASFVAYVTGISKINPLAPHYLCPECFYTEFHPESDCGWDLAAMACPRCGCRLKKDGHKLHEMIAFGGDGHKVPSMILGFDEVYAHKAKNIVNKFSCGNGIARFAKEIICIRESRHMMYLKKLQSNDGASPDTSVHFDGINFLHFCNDFDSLTKFADDDNFLCLIRNFNPRSFGELIRIAALVDAIGGAAVDMAEPNKYDFNCKIYCLEDIAEYLLEKNIDVSAVYKICVFLKKGKPLTPELKKLMSDKAVSLNGALFSQKYFPSKIEGLYRMLYFVYYNQKINHNDGVFSNE